VDLGSPNPSQIQVAAKRNKEKSFFNFGFSLEDGKLRLNAG